MAVFSPADILIPKDIPLKNWAVIACDQFTSQPEYWERVKKNAADSPSAIHLILPEAELGAPDEEQKIKDINRTMDEYLKEGVFENYPDSFIYVERTMQNGSIRKGLIGKIDLEDYDYHEGSTSPIRATEMTVLERIPPRMRVRRDAPLEMSHVLLLCDDDEKMLIEPLTDCKDSFRCLYDFDLCEDGGHISGWLVNDDQTAAFMERLDEFVAKTGEKYPDLKGTPMVFATGDGNHSLASAKACYEELKTADPDEDFSDNPCRYALVELENIHDDALSFEPIHRILTGVDTEDLLESLKECCCADEGYMLRYYTKDKNGTLYLDPQKGELAVGILQNFLDDYLSSHKGSIDYIHGDDTLISLAAADNAVGFLLPAMEKSQLFRGVIADGALPRKTFSMGHAQEKRYYLEARKLRD